MNGAGPDTCTCHSPCKAGSKEVQKPRKSSKGGVGVQEHAGATKRDDQIVSDVRLQHLCNAV
eukprot:2840562-Alexandrium_andersonii.AAC.1